MSTYKQVSYGSKGSDVTELQKLLNKNGATLDEDGIFGNNTKQAVKDYQQKNGLAADGIVGNNTWGALTKAQSGSPAASTPAASPAETKAPAFEYEPYKPSDTVAQAEALLQQQMANKPGAYQSTWAGQLNDTIAQILNREKFSYDLNGDMLYQQYADQYRTQGKLAMMDTMGQAAAMTGGYGNSYAQSVGQQAYQSYLQQLNDKVPELYGMALDQYNREGQAMYDQASLLAGMEEQEYGRYMDQLTNYYTELGMAKDDARYQAEQDYGRWADHLNLTYDQYRDSVADQQWQAQFDEAKRQYDQQYAASTSKSTGSSSGSRSGETGGGKYTSNPGWDNAKIKAFQQSHGLAVDGIWGPKTAAAYDKDPNWTGGGGGTPTDTDNTKLFRSSIMTGTEFARHGNKATVKGKTYTSYKSYIEAALADWTDNDVPHLGKNLTDDEVKFLMDYYGL
jgi:peptidoglycan hydrolase-like protein with peptidoglycan-binding domain